MGSIENVLNGNYFNPVSKEFKQAENVFYHLSGWKKAVVVTLAFFAAIPLPVFGGFVMFRWMVNILKPKANHTADKVDRVRDSVVDRFSTSTSSPKSSASVAVSHNPVAKETGKTGETKKAVSKFLPAQEGDIQKKRVEIQQFKQAALGVFHNAAPARPTEHLALSEEQKKTLLLADQNKCNKSQLAQCEGVKVIRGGCNFVFFLASAPGFVFKPMEKLKDAETYVAVSERARQILVEDNLYLLDAPHSQIVEINGKYFVRQEKADLISGDFHDQKGIYTFGWADEEMKPYMKALFAQLLIFICKMQFADVKFDNIPLTKEGRVALIDLDGISAATGLMTGRAGKKDGLFSYIPLEYLDEFLGMAKDKLAQTPEVYQKLAMEMATFKARAEQKKRAMEGYVTFVNKNGIVAGTQKINPNALELFSDPKGLVG